jgi:ubiquitin carboxyl-terminal hydrolase L5
MSDGGWNTIDSDASVFSELVENLHIHDVEINDIYAIDSEFLATLAPLHGVIFLFKYGNLDSESCRNDKPVFGEYDRNYHDHGIVFANQTIQNACATIAVLNILLNKSQQVDLGHDISEFKSFITGFDGEMVGETISNSDLIRSVHNSFSAPSYLASDDPAKKPEDYDKSELYHFVSFVRLNDHIYELDGLKSYPIQHVECASDEEFITKLPEIINQRIARYGNELRFSLLAVTNNKLLQAQSMNDEVEIQTQLQKRENWKQENELRKHEYTGLIIELLKNISGQMSDEEWTEFLKSASNKSQSALLDMIKNKNQG